MITLYGISPAWGLPDRSPFVSKVDCYLRMVELPYTLVSLLGENSTKSITRLSSGELPARPKGKFPYIDDGGTVIGDSSFIIDYLRGKYRDTLGENNLRSEERAIALCVRRMVEEHLYWVLVYLHWMEDAIWEANKPMVFGSQLPSQIETFREDVRRDLHGQGLGRHTRSEVYELGNADLSALAVHMADKPYALGERPTELDATVYAFLSHILWCPYESPLKTHFSALPNLEAYCQRMHKQYYSSRH